MPSLPRLAIPNFEPARLAKPENAGPPERAVFARFGVQGEGSAPLLPGVSRQCFINSSFYIRLIISVLVFNSSPRRRLSESA